MKSNLAFLDYLLDMSVEHEYKSKKILVIDDDESILNWFLSLQKSKNPYSFYMLQDELKVLETVEKIRPDLIFIDLFLNKISGEKIGEVIRTTNHFNIPLVYMSSWNVGPFDHRVPEHAFMKKPLDRREVEGKIKKILKF